MKSWLVHYITQQDHLADDIWWLQLANSLNVLCNGTIKISFATNISHTKPIKATTLLIMHMLKKVQKATKILPALRNLSYIERLKKCRMTTLHFRPTRGDMIERYKIVTGKYQTSVAPSLIKESTYVTRGNDLRLKKFHVNYDLRKFSFSNMVISKWNSLPNWVVSANTTDTFEAWLNKFWHNQHILEHSCTEPEVGVTCRVSSSSKFQGSQQEKINFRTKFF